MTQIYSEETQFLRSALVSNVSILLFREFLLKGVAFIGQLILARILTPADFGTFAIISFIISFATIFSDIGLTSAIIQKRDEVSENTIHGVVTVKVVINVLLMLVIWVFAPFTKNIYHSFTNSNVLMLQILSLTLILSAVQSVSVALLERKLFYKAISKIDISGIVSYYILAVSCAFFGLGLWSFIFAAIGMQFVQMIFAYSLYPFSFIPNIKDLKKDFIHFGFFVQANGIVNFFYTALIPVVAGVTSGPTAVGLLDWANNIVSIPESITNNFSRVAFSGFSRIQKNIEILTKSIESSLRFLSLVTYFFIIIFLGFGYEGTKLLYTAKWLPAVPALYWYGISIVFFPGVACFAQALLSTKNSKYAFYATLLSNIIGWISGIILVTRFQFIGIAMAACITFASLFFSYLFFMKKIGIRPSVLASILPKAIVSGITLFIVVFLNIILPQTLLLLVFKILVASSCYLLLSFVVSKKDVIFVFEILKGFYSKK